MAEPIYQTALIVGAGDGISSEGLAGIDRGLRSAWLILVDSS